MENPPDYRVARVLELGCASGGNLIPYAIAYPESKCIGIDLSKHDLRFQEDDWESPTIGAWGLGWQVVLDGMEITQFTYFQQIWGATTDIKDLITAIDARIECVPLKTPDIEDQILGINNRINDVVDRLRLEPDGTFSAEAFCANLSSDLKENMLAYETRATDLKAEIEANIASTVDLSANVLPKGYY